MHMDRLCTKYLNLCVANPIFQTYVGGIPPSITRLLSEIDINFQRLHRNFDDGHSNGTTGEPATYNRKWIFQDGGL